MTPRQLAHEFTLGIRAALSCPDVSVSEYESVMERHLLGAMRDCVILGASMYAGELGDSQLMSDNAALSAVRDRAIAVITDETVETGTAKEKA